MKFIATALFAVYGANGHSCTTPSGGAGNCVAITKCDALMTLVGKINRTPKETVMLQKSACGFQGSLPKVCCPLPCYTPEGHLGTCIGIYSCPHIVNMLKQQPVPNENVQYVQRTRCQGPDQYSVCCGPAPTEPVRKENFHNTALPPDPSCGLDANNGNRIVGGNETAIDQYPWLVLIEYTTSLMCGGTLISNKYVLTAAHCVTGKILERGTPTNVRLGEYDRRNEGTDCVVVEGGGEDCTDPALRVPIETFVAHEEYNPITKLHDIGLIRLRDAAPYTDFIRPICLPSTDITLSPPSPFVLFAAGWGYVNATVRSSPIKLHVDLPYVRLQTCQAAYKTRATLWERQICAGGKKNKDSCKGDSGGPLMYQNGKIFELIGVVSFGPTPCGAESVPGVYTKVFQYKDWISSKIVP